MGSWTVNNNMTRLNHDLCNSLHKDVYFSSLEVLQRFLAVPYDTYDLLTCSEASCNVHYITVHDTNVLDGVNRLTMLKLSSHSWKAHGVTKKVIPLLSRMCITLPTRFSCELVKKEESRNVQIGFILTRRIVVNLMLVSFTT